LLLCKDSISRPILRTSNKLVKKEAVDVFKQVQIYMGDRLAKTSPTEAALQVVSCGWTNRELRDEIFVQLCRQTTKNPKPSVMFIHFPKGPVTLADNDNCQ